MNFYDLNPSTLPRDARYYFNILVVTIAMPQQQEGIQDVWDISRITSPRPAAFHVYCGDEPSIQFYQHAVVEISDSLGISFYNGGN